MIPGARKSLTHKSAYQISDSEDSELSDDVSDVSLFDSEMGSDPLEGSEDSDGNADPIINDTIEESNPTATMVSAANIAGSDPRTEPAVTSRRRRTRTTRDGNATRIRRRHGRFEDRVSYYYIMHDLQH